MSRVGDVKVIGWGVLVWLLMGGASSADSVLDWQKLPPLPKEAAIQHAAAGATSAGLVVAGGYTKQSITDAVWILAEKADEWKTAPVQLPQPLAEAVSLTWQDPVTKQSNVVIVGGTDGQRETDAAMLLRSHGDSLEFEMLPPLPQPLAASCGGIVGDTLYVFGGRSAGSQSNALYTLKLSATPSERSWQAGPPCPGSPRQSAVAGVARGSFFIFGGLGQQPGLGLVDLLDCYQFQPGSGWKRRHDLPVRISDTPRIALPLGARTLVIPQTRIAAGEGEPQMLVYHTSTDNWAQSDYYLNQKTDKLWGVSGGAAVAPWRGQFVFVGGTRDNISPQASVWEARRVARVSSVRPLDVLVLVAYFVVIAAIGFYFARQKGETDEYFLGSRKIPWWAAGISIFGGQISAITFLTLTARAFDSDWTPLLGNFTIVMMAPIVIGFYLPFYRRLRVTSIYEYLERRFSVPIRIIAATTFVVLHLARVMIVLYLPAMVIASVTGVSITAAILTIGILTTVYTTVGGAEAVVWTDVLQVVVLFSGAFLALFVAVSHVDGGLAAIFSSGWEAGKFRMFQWQMRPLDSLVWVVVLGRLFEQFVPYTADQTVAQRYLMTSTSKEASRSIWTNALMSVPTTLLFGLIGTVLWTYYRAHPENLDPQGKGDEVFPWFIAHQLPAGISGLIIAAVFAAAQSTLSANLNSIATVTTTDFYRKWRPLASERDALRVAKSMSVLAGVVGTLFACWMAYSPTLGESVWDANILYVGMIGGPLAGLFLVGIFAPRAGSLAAGIGFFAGIAAVATARASGQVPFLLNPALAMLTTLLVSWGASFAFPNKQGRQPGLTVWSGPET